MIKGKSGKIQKFVIILSFAILFAWATVNYIHTRANKNPNVIIITLDALNADHLGCYGYHRNTTPNIDKLAKGGVMFTNAISQTAWTAGSLASLLTSTYPSTNRIDKWGAVLDKRFITLAEVLKNEKYVTACSINGDWVDQDIPWIRRGFDHFFNANDETELFKQAVDWVRHNKRHNFFIWMHLFNYPHAPYNPPPPFNKMFLSNQPPQNLPISKEDEVIFSTGIIPSWVADNNITDVNYYISQYDGEIAFADSLIGKLMDALKKEWLKTNTIVIISADHGESLGKRGIYFQHGVCVYNDEIRIPLIISGSTIPRGLVVKYPVQLIDIMPSLADMLGIKLDYETDGKSFSPFTSEREGNFVFSEIGAVKMLGRFKQKVQYRTVIFGDWKLISEQAEDSINYQLFNLKTDPDELHNVAKTEKGKFLFLKQKLEDWLHRPRLNVAPEVKPLSQEERKRLRSLGYFQ